MTFLAPWFLLGALAAAIPLVLHLRRSRRRNTITFSTTRFFDEQFLRTARRARVQDLLLMLLRMALLALFAIALAQPLLRWPGLAGVPGLGGGQRTVAIVLDDSASMGRVSEKGVLLERAKDAALNVVDELSAAQGDRVLLTLAGARQPEPAMPLRKPSGDLEQARQAIRSVSETDLGTDLPGAVKAAREALPGGSRGGEIYVFSDATESALPEGRKLNPGPQNALMMVAVRPDEPAGANVSVEAVQYGASRPMLGVPFTFRALLRNHGREARKVQLRLRVGDSTVAQREVQVPAGRGKISRFAHRFTEPGWHRGRVEIEPVSDTAPDVMPADNRRHFALRVQHRLSVLAVNGAPSQSPTQDELLFFRMALTAGAGSAGEASRQQISVDEVRPAEFAQKDLKPYDLVLLANAADMPQGGRGALEQYVDGGGNLLVTLGDRINREAYHRWVGDNRLHGGLLPGTVGPLVEDQQRAGFIGWVDEKHPAMAGFGEGSLGDLSSVHFRKRYQLDVPEQRVLMRSSTGDPVLAAKRFGRGRVMLFASTIDRDWTNFPIQPVFVPWVYRVVGHLARPAMGGAGFFIAGRTIELPASVTEQTNPKVTKPNGEVAYPSPSDDGGTMRFDETETAGVYTVRDAAGEGGSNESGEPAYAFAVNPPETESRLGAPGKDRIAERIAPDAAWTWIDTPAGVTQASQLARQGWGLWDLLLLVALAVALFEPWLANRLTRQRTGAVADPTQQRSTPAGEGAARRAA